MDGWNGRGKERNGWEKVGSDAEETRDVMRRKFSLEREKE
jgi:hypothetical protein